MKFAFALAAIPFALLGACSQEPADSPQAEIAEPEALDTSGPGGGPQPTFYSADGLIGLWTGVEGMFLDIRPTGDGTYQLEMQSDLDTRGTYVGTPGAEGISFERGGEQFTLVGGDGAATGLKWLDGKEDCLIVRAGEGYCRD